MEEDQSQRAIHLLSGEGKMVWFVGALDTLKLVGKDTGGAFFLLEEVTPPQVGPPLHRHTREDETFYVLDGEMEFVVGGRTLLASAGSVVYGPRDIPHSYRNVGTTPSRMSVFYTPAGFEGAYEELGEPVTDPSVPPKRPPLDIERISAVGQKYGVEVLPPPNDEAGFRECSRLQKGPEMRKGSFAGIMSYRKC